MDKLTKRQKTSLIIIFIVVVAIPLTIYLARQTQIFKPRAGNPAVSRIEIWKNGSEVTGNPPTVTGANVDLKIFNVPQPGSGGTIPSSDPSAIASPDQNFKRVFVTDTRYNSYELGGLTGADDKCQAAANSAGAGGTWKAWLSGTAPNVYTAAESPANRFSRSSVAYVSLRPNVATGQIDKIADNWADLTDGTLDNGIHISESGQRIFSDNNSVGNDYVWTNTKGDGTADFLSCQNWMPVAYPSYNPNELVFQARIGRTNYGPTTLGWTQSGTPYRCDLASSKARLYCFEQ